MDDFVDGWNECFPERWIWKRLVPSPEYCESLRRPPNSVYWELYLERFTYMLVRKRYKKLLSRPSDLQVGVIRNQCFYCHVLKGKEEISRVVEVSSCHTGIGEAETPIGFMAAEGRSDWSMMKRITTQHLHIKHPACRPVDRRKGYVPRIAVHKKGIEIPARKKRGGIIIKP